MYNGAVLSNFTLKARELIGLCGEGLIFKTTKGLSGMVTDGEIV